MSQLQIEATTRLPRIKVCGLTCRQELDFLVAAGVDAVGINLVPSSKRCVELAMAIELCHTARQLGLLTVAVLRNPSRDRLLEVQTAASWDFIQLHGSEVPELVSQQGSISIIKAVSWTGLPEEAELVRQWTRWGAEKLDQAGVGTAERTQRLACFLIDAYAPEEGGGTGRTANWALLSPRPSIFQGQKLLLAGGLTPHNVRLAIQSTACDGVDTASGVESSPGRKSKELIIAFAKEAGKGFVESSGGPLQ